MTTEQMIFLVAMGVLYNTIGSGTFVGKSLRSEYILFR